MPVTRRWLSACMLLGSLLAFIPELAPAAGAGYAIAVVPALPPTEIKRRWQPLLDQLQRDTGFALKFRFYKDNVEFEEGLLKGEPDFAMIGPFQAWKVRAQYRPLVRDAAPMIGMVLVRKDSRLQSLTDLHERSLATPGGSDMATTLLYAQEFRSTRIRPRLQAQRTHVNGLRAVLLGRIDAAIINSYSLRLMPAGLEQQLRPIHRMPPMPGPAFAAARRVPDEDVSKMKEALLHLKADHADLLASALMPNITDADLEQDYSVFASLMSVEIPDATP